VFRLDETGAFGVCKASVHTGQFSITGPRTPVLKMLQEVAAPKDCTRLDVLPDMSFTLMGTEFSVTRNEYVVYVICVSCRLLSSVVVCCRLLCTVHRSTRRWDHFTDHPHLFFFLLLFAPPIATNCHQLPPIRTLSVFYSYADAFGEKECLTALTPDGTIFGLLEPLSMWIFGDVWVRSFYTVFEKVREDSW
jgi:hypothetical protein